MLRALYDWTMRIAGHRHALSWLAVVSFVESSVFPIPVDALLIPMVLADRAKAWWIGTIATVFSVLGGLGGYIIGLYLFDSVGRPILELYGKAAAFSEFQAGYNEWGAWIVLMAGLTPFPYKVVTIASGVTQLDLWVFTIASILSRGLRFYLEVCLLFFFGAPIRAFIERHLSVLFTLGLGLLFGGFLVVRYLL